MVVRRVGATAIWSLLALVLAFSAFPASAQNIAHFGKNRVELAPVDPFLLPDADGAGIVDYEGSKEPSSQWRASFRFTGLQPGNNYTVVIKGRFGDPSSVEADTLTPLCAFTADASGEGSCFWYFRGLARLNLVQLRAGDENGPRVLEASRTSGPGSIETEPNRHSPGGEIPPRKKNGRSSR